MENMTWTQKVNYQLRLFLWTYYVDYILLIHLERNSDRVYRLKRPRLEDYGFWRLLEASVLTRSHQLLVMAIFFNFFMNANLISLFVVFSVQFYSILENPLPSSRFWKFMMSYLLTVISLKFLYQLPIFCGTPVYTFYSDKCNNEELTPQTLASRIDYIIGIRKFSGPASYPKNQGIFVGIFADVTLLMFMLIHKQYLSKIGAWNYVKSNSNIYVNPSFSIDKEEPAPSEDLLNEDDEQDEPAFYEKLWSQVVDGFNAFTNFFEKVLPQYMSRK